MQSFTCMAKLVDNGCSRFQRLTFCCERQLMLLVKNKLSKRNLDWYDLFCIVILNFQ